MALRSMIRLVDPFGMLDRFSATPSRPSELVGIVADLRFELVPMKSVETAIRDLSPGSRVSVTCSPAKGIPATVELTEKLVADGHDVVPHIAARLVEGPGQVADLARWIGAVGLESIFVIAGDAEDPAGPYLGAVEFLRDLLEHETGLSHVGIAGYPDGHTLIDDDTLSDALHAKQTLFAEVGVQGSVTTQMCFDATKIHDWLATERARGLTLPVHLGLPGVVDRAKLVTMGTRLGVGPSLRYLRKNRASLTRMLAPGGYDPSELLLDLVKESPDLDIAGLHSFTFNRVGATRQWQAEFVNAAHS
ncbi:MAG: 5,10-methylenetetrahydrofolate reductase [Actinomycetia bacterium]|nr:5,10-methylenetetrahydrofolate reductase [Actinomycetes bacterium]